MRKIIAIEPPTGDQTPSDSLVLDFDYRNRRRIVLTTRAGETLLLDMPRAVHMRHGDVARLHDGGLIAIEAAQEAVIDIVAHDSAALVRIAWHLGNRHLPTQFIQGRDGGHIRIREDHVICAMVEGLGGRCTGMTSPFDPERGAYADTPVPAADRHHHLHGHHHGHD